MTRDEANQTCERLAAESPDRETHRWIPRQERDGSWSVVKVGLPPATDASTAETRADERPPTPDDPRSPLTKYLGGYASGG